MGHPTSGRGDAKRRLNGISKVNKQTHRPTDTQTDKHMDISCYTEHRPRRPKLGKLHFEGTYPQTLRLTPQLGQEGRVGDKKTQ